MKYIESKNTNPYYNLALEEHLFKQTTDDYFMLWQNDNTIVVGRFQNSAEEINEKFVKEKEINIVRRITGGGAVYHDLGNLNFSFITNDLTQPSKDSFYFEYFTKYITETLYKYNVNAEFNSRNDITINGKKISGNSECHSNGRILHHGTILFNSDLTVVSHALNVNNSKFRSKATKSVKSRITNIIEYLPSGITLDNFKTTLKETVFKNTQIEEVFLTPEIEIQVKKLRDKKYLTWDWNYGKSPKYTILKKGRCSGGFVEIFLDIRNGFIYSLEIRGDFFAQESLEESVRAFYGLRYDKSVLSPAVSLLCSSMHNVDENWMLNLIFS